MEKQVFLDRVSRALLDRGLAQPIVERQIDKLSRYIDQEWGENPSAMLGDENPEMLAEEIYSIVRKAAARRAAAEAATAEIEIPAAEPAQPAQSARPLRQPAPARAAAPEMRVDVVDLPGHPRAGEMPAEDYIEPDPTAFGQAGSPVTAIDYDPAAQTIAPNRSDRRRKTLEVDPIGSRAAEYADEKGGPLFWVMFCISLPFAAAIGLLVLSLFVAVFAALITLMIASIAALAVVAAAGTAFTLVALVYGIVQALSTLPIGLYEIGIGIVAGAAVLFVSILLYNFAIRLLPFLMRLLARFLMWTMRRLRDLFIFVKGACAKL